MSNAQFEFDPSFQLKIAALFMRDTSFAKKVKDLLLPQYFTETATGDVVRIIKAHVETYNQVPDRSMINQMVKDELAANRIRKDQLPDIINSLKHILTADLSNPTYVSDKVVSFAKHQAIENAMMQSITLLEKGQFDKIGEIMSRANNVGLVSDGDDYDYFEEIKNRSQQRQDLLAGKIIRNGITTGYSEIDSNLYHYGWGRQELSVIMGPAKAGKSMSLGDFGKNACLAGYNVLLDSLEVSADIIAQRLDANFADTAMRSLHTDWQGVEAAVLAAQAKSGHFKMRTHATGTLKPSQLARIIEGYRSEGIILDLIIPDYADIMAAEYRSDNLIDNLRSIYIDLRAIAFEFNCAMLTATQTNRDGAKAATAKATDVGDDWNKVRTADVFLGISATEAEKQIGEARLTWLASRNTEDGFSLRLKQDRSKMQFVKKVLGRVI